jgi:hypothetical protein
VKLPWRRQADAPIGSARWWWQVLSDIGIRLLSVVLLLWLLAAGGVTGLGFWICVAGLAIMVLLLAIKVSVCVIALRNPDALGSQEPPRV